jgi:hypothetical protein
MAEATQTETHKLAAIMFTDMVGFSGQMGVDENRMLRLLEVHNQLIQRAVAEHHGTVIKTVGDAFLVDFPSVVHAVQCAQQIQSQLRAHNAEKAKDEQIHVRIGIHSGDIVQKDGDVFGDGVNIASRLQALAEQDTICILQTVYKEVEKKLPLGTVVSLGKPNLLATGCWLLTTFFDFSRLRGLVARDYNPNGKPLHERRVSNGSTAKTRSDHGRSDRSRRACQSAGTARTVRSQLGMVSGPCSGDLLPASWQVHLYSWRGAICR